jgi:antitoxin (DNA-binding transcriptional repressor) of toxin-antitoxin stability system
VKAGESVVITDRGIPVAVLEPVPGRVDMDERIESLVRRGHVRRGTGKIDLEALRNGRPTPPGGADIVRILLDERESGW